MSIPGISARPSSTVCSRYLKARSDCFGKTCKHHLSAHSPCSTPSRAHPRHDTCSHRKPAYKSQSDRRPTWPNTADISGFPSPRCGTRYPKVPRNERVITRMILAGGCIPYSKSGTAHHRGPKFDRNCRLGCRFLVARSMLSRRIFGSFCHSTQNSTDLRLIYR